MPSRYTGGIQYVPQEVDRWYNLVLLDVMVGKTSLGCMYLLNLKEVC